MKNELVFRYAPTPSGFLHAGNLFNFTLNFLLAKALNAKILLRIDDLDTARTRPEYVQHIFDCLNSFGLTYDFGPKNLDDFEHNWSQEFRIPLYQSAFEVLKQKGVVFPSNLSRTELMSSYNGIYPKELVGNEPEKPDSAWRLNIQVEDSNLPGFLKMNSTIENEGLEISQYPIIRKKDGQFAYQLTSVVDDVYYGVTHIVRGEDLYPSSLIQVALKNLIYPELQNWSFHHHYLWKNDGRKLSKSDKVGIKINPNSLAEFNEILIQCKIYLNISGNNLLELTESIKLKINALQTILR